MALQVWLPLNGDLHNLGLKKYNLSMFRGTEVYNNNGKIGKCFYANGVNTIKILNIIPDFYNYTAYSLCAWIYIEAQNTSHTGSGVISAGNWNNQVLNLGLSDWSTDHYTRLRISGTNWSRTYSYNFSLNTWYHIVVSSDSNKTYAYVNGNLIGDSQANFLPTSIEGNDMCIGGATYYSGMLFFGRINDVRIYDHALSAKEVKEISLGLVLHYLLNLPNINLLNEETFSSSPWLGAIKAYEVYYDKLSYRVANNTLYSLSGNGANNIFPNVTYEANTQYTISVDWRDDYRTDGKSSSLYLRFKYSDDTYNLIISPANSILSWTHSKLTSTAGKTVVAITTTYGNGGQLYIANLKLEKGNMETPYINNNSNIIYDSSGYKNNALSNGSKPITSENNSIKYKNCTNFISGSRIATPIASSVFLPKDMLTVSIWIKTTASANRFLSCTESGGFNFESASGAVSMPLYISGKGYTRVNGTTTWANLSDNNWHMITATYDRLNIKLYIDGILDTSTASSYPNIDIGYNSSTPFTLGAEALTIASPIAGTYVGGLSDCRIYATALSADDVLELYKTSKIVSGTTVSPRSLE